MADASHRRWSVPTPGRLLPVLLAVEGLLWLSERFQWMSKGWPVVTAIAAVGIFLLLMLLWFLLALLLRWRFQFSILSLFVLTVAVALPCGWLETETKAAEREREVVKRIRDAYGDVTYDWQTDANGLTRANAKPPAPAWLGTLLGHDFFETVRMVQSQDSRFDDAALESVKGLCNFRR